MKKPITTRAELVAALRDVAELEQQFMCMYLYSAFSLKKDPDEACNAAQLEAVRRWTSRIYMIARQEMEHLALVNGMLAAIGAPPHLTRQNVPSLSPHFQSKVLTRASLLHHASGRDKCDLPFLFEPFDLLSARRFACMESAEVVHLTEEQREVVLNWCFKDTAGSCPCVLPQAGRNLALHRSHLAQLQGANDVEVGTIEMAYEHLWEGFVNVAGSDPNLFVGSCDQRQVSVLNEYNIFIFPITDLTSVKNAIDLITQQGEGLGAPPGFESHFVNFVSIVQEYQGLLGVAGCNEAPKTAFQPCRAVPGSPTGSEIEDEYTRRVFDLFNYSYVTLLHVLTGLYGWYRPNETSYPYFSTALREISFAPLMTMLIRSLGEVLVQLPLRAGDARRAGPNFHIPPADDQQLIIPDTADWQHGVAAQDYLNIDFYLKRLEEVDTRLKALAQEAPAHVKKEMDYIAENVYRTAGNLRQDYQSGVYKKFRTTP